MSENQKQIIEDITNMIPFVNIKVAQSIKNLIEVEIEQEILRINPDVDFEDMDITEKIMLLEHVSKSEEQKAIEKKEAIPFETILREEGINIDDL